MKLQPYWIEWRDAAKAGDRDQSWYTLSSLTAEPPVVVTVGFVVNQSEHALLVVHSLDKSCSKEEEEDVMGPVIIPKKMIVRKRKLEVPE